MGSNLSTIVVKACYSFKPAILNLGYARSLQGVRQILNLLKISLYKSNISLKKLTKDLNQLKISLFLSFISITMISGVCKGYQFYLGARRGVKLWFGGKQKGLNPIWGYTSIKRLRTPGLNHSPNLVFWCKMLLLKMICCPAIYCLKNIKLPLYRYQ